MKYINLNNNFNVDREKMKEVPPDTTLTINWIGHGLDSGFQKGISSDMRKIRANILKKLETAEKSGAKVLELNEFEHKFVLDAFSRGTCSIQEAPFITIAEDALLNATDIMSEIAAPQEETTVPVETEIVTSDNAPQEEAQ